MSAVAAVITGAAGAIAAIVIVVIFMTRKASIVPDSGESSCKDTENHTSLSSSQTIYFRNGIMYKVIPSEKDGWYDARYLVSDGKRYDLERVDDIRRIPVPSFSAHRDTMAGYGITGELDYVLRMKAGQFYRRVEKNLCSACLWKATELMLAKPFSGWRKNDYYRLVYWHDELGMFDEAEKARKYLSHFDFSTENTFDITAKQILVSVMKHSPEFVAFDDYGSGCCAKCAPLRGRVYSVNGHSRTFPPLPTYAKKHGNFHSGCRCSMSLYLEGTPIYYKGVQVDAVTASTRPWKDDRTQEEIDAYNDYLQHVADEEAAEEQRAIYSHNKGIRRLEFEAIKEAFPDLAPKSLTGYSRMKTQRTKNFMRLYDLATQAGIYIDLPEK